MAGSEHITQSLINLIYKLFICRTDRYGIQWCRDGEVGYRAEKGEITRQLLREHLEGRKTIGIYSAPPGMTRWMVFDFDSMDLGPVKKLQAFLNNQGVPVCLEFSGKKGYHLWIFLNGLAPNWKIRDVARRAAEESGISEVEVFPAQDKVSKEHPGSLIKLPMGKHQATGRWCLFTGDDGKPYPNQYDFLSKVQRVDIGMLTYKLGIQKKSGASRPRRSIYNNTNKSSRQLKPCVENLIRDGIEEGYRKKAAFLIACELRRSNPRVSKDAVGGVLAAFALRCDPQPRRDELQDVIRSAFKDDDLPYEYGCSWGGPPLSEKVDKYCVGKGNCIYLDLLKNMQTGRKGNGR